MSSAKDTKVPPAAGHGVKTTLPTLGSSREGFRNGSFTGDCRGVSVLDEDSPVEAVPRAKSTSPATDEPATPAAATVQEQQGLLGSLLHDAAPDQGRAPCHPEGSWGGSAAAVDQARHPVPHRGAPADEGRERDDQVRKDHARAVVQRAAQSSPAQANPRDLLYRGAGDEADRERSHGPHGDESYGDTSGKVSSRKSGCGRLREACRRDLHDHQGEPPRLRSLGDGHLEGVWNRRSGPSIGSTGSMAPGSAGPTGQPAEDEADAWRRLPHQGNDQEEKPRGVHELFDTDDKLEPGPLGEEARDDGRYHGDDAQGASRVKGERPRKSQGRMEDDSMSDGSFKVISKPPGTPS